MTSRTSKLFALSGGLLALSACHGDNLNTHGCPLEYSTGWSGRGLDLEHTLPESCPVFLSSPGQVKQTGAKVIDGGTAEFEEAFLNVYDNSGDPAGLTFNSFRYGSDGKWSTAIVADYQAGRDNFSADKANFRLTYKGGVPGPSATMRITYTNNVSASISGPATVLDGSSNTFTANITAGEAPFTYRWYRDWELVGTGNSYTDYWGGAASADLRLDVVDARGEADSHWMNITISACTEGTRYC